jgi:hypothetical protein
MEVSRRSDAAPGAPRGMRKLWRLFLCPLRYHGDTKVTQQIRSSQKPEAQADQKSFKYPNPHIHSEPNFPDTFAQTVRVEEIHNTAKYLVQSLERLRERVIKTIEELRSPQEFPGPPDPFKGGSNGDFKWIQGEKEDLGAPLRSEEDVMTFTGLNPQFITGEIFSARWTINQSTYKVESAPTHKPIQYQSRVLCRKSSIGTMAST